MKNILIFNDISGLGNCSMCANLPIFTQLGHYCMPIVTASFSCQTGFEKFTVQKNENISRCVDDISFNRRPNAVYVGFCVDSRILADVRAAAERFPEAYVFVDPILGDNGKLYSVFDCNYVDEMKRAVKNADCISPNLTEACLLADIDFGKVVSCSDKSDYTEFCCEIFGDFLQKTGAKNAVITGVTFGDSIANIVLQRGKSPQIVLNKRVPVNFSGTGDAFSSALCGKLLNDCDIVSATRSAADFVGTAAALTQCSDRRFGVEFFRAADLL